MYLTCTETIRNYKREEMGPFLAKFILELLTFCFCKYFLGGEKRSRNTTTCSFQPQVDSLSAPFLFIYWVNKNAEKLHNSVKSS